MDGEKDNGKKIDSGIEEFLGGWKKRLEWIGKDF